MKDIPDFSSSLADRLIEFIAFKRMQGYDYSAAIPLLMKFDSFLSRTGFEGETLCVQLMKRYMAQMTGLSLNAHQSTIRQFSIYLHALNGHSEVLSSSFNPRCRRSIRFYFFTEDQVRALMTEALNLSPKRSVWGHCFHFLIGLLYSTGLRIREALALNVGNLDMERATLFVRQGKFRKERLVPMSSSTLEATARWMRCRRPHAQADASAPLLILRGNKGPSYSHVAHTFRKLCQRCGIEGDPPPRLHDLRHSYASRTIALWRQKGQDVNARLPILANVMGHVDFFATQCYLHLDPKALEQAADKFRNHAKNNKVI